MAPAAVIAVAGGGKRELLDRRISRELEELMSTRGQYAADSCTLPVVDTDERYAVAVAAPILSEGDVLGCVLFDGWLCATITAAQLARIARWNNSRGWTIEAFKLPLDTGSTAVR